MTLTRAGSRMQTSNPELRSGNDDLSVERVESDVPVDQGTGTTTHDEGALPETTAEDASEEQLASAIVLEDSQATQVSEEDGMEAETPMTRANATDALPVAEEEAYNEQAAGTQADPKVPRFDNNSPIKKAARVASFEAKLKAMQTMFEARLDEMAAKIAALTVEQAKLRQENTDLKLNQELLQAQVNGQAAATATSEKITAATIATFQTKQDAASKSWADIVKARHTDARVLDVLSKRTSVLIETKKRADIATAAVIEGPRLDSSMKQPAREFLQDIAQDMRFNPSYNAVFTRKNRVNQLMVHFTSIHERLLFFKAFNATFRSRSSGLRSCKALTTEQIRINKAQRHQTTGSARVRSELPA